MPNKEQEVYVGLLLAYSVALVCLYRQRQSAQNTQKKRHVNKKEYILLKKRIAMIFLYISKKTNMC